MTPRDLYRLAWQYLPKDRLDEVLHSWARRLHGAESLKSLDANQLRAIADQVRLLPRREQLAAGDAPGPIRKHAPRRPRPASGNLRLCSPAQRDYIRGLASERGWDEQALNDYLRKYFKVDGLDKLADSRDARDCIDRLLKIVTEWYQQRIVDTARAAGWNHSRFVAFLGRHQLRAVKHIRLKTTARNVLSALLAEIASDGQADRSHHASHFKADNQSEEASHSAVDTHNVEASQVELDTRTTKASQRLQDTQKILASQAGIDTQSTKASHDPIDTQGAEASHVPIDTQVTQASRSGRVTQNVGVIQERRVPQCPSAGRSDQDTHNSPAIHTAFSVSSAPPWCNSSSRPGKTVTQKRAAGQGFQGTRCPTAGQVKQATHCVPAGLTGSATQAIYAGHDGGDTRSTSAGRKARVLPKNESRRYVRATHLLSACRSGQDSQGFTASHPCGDTHSVRASQRRQGTQGPTASRNRRATQRFSARLFGQDTRGPRASQSTTDIQHGFASRGGFDTQPRNACLCHEATRYMIAGRGKQAARKSVASHVARVTHSFSASHCSPDTQRQEASLFGQDNRGSRASQWRLDTQNLEAGPLQTSAFSVTFVPSWFTVLMAGRPSRGNHCHAASRIVNDHRGLPAGHSIFDTQACHASRQLQDHQAALASRAHEVAQPLESRRSNNTSQPTITSAPPAERSPKKGCEPRNCRVFNHRRSAGGISRRTNAPAARVAPWPADRRVCSCPVGARRLS